MDRDKLLRGDLRDAYQAAYRLLDRIQDIRPSTQIQGLAVVVIAIADALGIDRKELFELGGKLAELGSEKKLKLYSALKDYAKNELK